MAPGRVAEGPWSAWALQEEVRSSPSWGFTAPRYFSHQWFWAFSGTVSSLPVRAHESLAVTGHLPGAVPSWGSQTG